MAGNNGPKIITNGLKRSLDASQWGGWGAPEIGTYQNDIKDYSGNVVKIYGDNSGLIKTLNGVRCVSTLNVDPQAPPYPGYARLNLPNDDNLQYSSTASCPISISGNSNRTCECWFYLVDITATNNQFSNTTVSDFGLIVWGAASGSNLFHFGISSDNAIMIAFWNTKYLSSTVPSMLNRWVLIGMTNNASTTTFYLNGEAVSSSNITYATTGTGPVNYFRDSYAVNAPNGYWSALRIYNRQLSAAEMKQNFDAQRGRFKI